MMAVSESTAGCAELDPAGLTAKQSAVLDLVLQHKSNKEIARLLGISPSAVDQRLASARLRLGTQRRSETALAYARLRATCAKPTDANAQVAFPQLLGDQSAQADGERFLLLEDVGVAGNFSDWHGKLALRSGLRDLSVPANPWVRLGMIIVFALLIAVVALIGMSVTQGVVTLLKQ